MQPDPRLSGGIAGVLAQDEHGLAGSVVELQPGPDHPASAVRVQPVVVVEVQLAQGSRLVARVELDHADAAVVATDLLDVASQARCKLSVRGPDPVLVGLAVIPEAAAVHLASSRRERSEVSIAAALPVHVFQGLPFSWLNCGPLPVA
jgi:hypothetical protein